METTPAMDGAVAALGIGYFIWVGILGILSVIMLVFWIMQIIAAFKNEESPLMGILSIVLGICTSMLAPFIIGWIYASKWGIKKLMVNWTILVVISVIVGIIGGVLFGAAIATMDPAMLESMEVSP